VPPEFYAAISGQQCPITGEAIGQLRPDQMVLVELG
jgi:hypothetical protein